MPGEPEDYEEIDVTKFLERMEALEKEIDSQKTRLDALEKRDAEIQAALSECNENIDALAERLKGE